MTICTYFVHIDDHNSSLFQAMNMPEHSLDAEYKCKRFSKKKDFFMSGQKKHLTKKTKKSKKKILKKFFFLVGSHSKNP